MKADGKKPAMKPGISTLGFREWTNAQLGKEASATGFEIIQLFVARSDSPFWTDPTTMNGIQLATP